MGTQLAKARRALEAAQFLFKGGFFGDAVSRAYYSVFHAARAALLTQGIQPRTHKGVNERFNMDLVLSRKIEPEYLSILGREQTDRETADYSIEKEISEEQSKESVEE